MTPKEKARELVDIFWNLDMLDEDGYTFWINKDNAKESALICVDEILNENGFYTNTSVHTCKGRKQYWQEVKQEISKL